MNRKYYLEHREEICKQNMEHYHKNRDSIMKRRKELYQKNKDEINKKRREKYHSDPKYRAKEKAQDKKYYRNNKQKVLKSRKRYYQENREKVDMAHSNWAKRNSDKMREHWMRVYYKRRDMGFIPLMNNPFPDELDVDFHHVYPWFPFIVPIPRKVHLNYNMNLEKHIEHNKEWFEKLYSMDIDSLLGLKPM